MILLILILILIAGGILSWISGQRYPGLSRWIAVLTVLSDFIIILYLWIFCNTPHGSEINNWIIEYNHQWIDRFGIQFHLAIDGLSVLLLALAYFLGLLTVFVSWSQVRHKTGLFHLNLLWVLAGISGVFLSVDLFLFYFFWEVMLVPMYFLIGIWGSGNRINAAYKFFIFTQLSGLLMFLAILALYFTHASQTGVFTFEYNELLNTGFSRPASIFMFTGFIIAFFVKLPVIPFHSWLPEAYAEAPTAGSILLAGLLSKTAAYGMLRFAVPLFPDAAHLFSPLLMALGAATILYGAKLSWAQTDIKRIMAYASLSHMGFILIGIFAFNELAYQGVIMQVIAHGITIGALFVLAGALQERNHTLDIGVYGGLWSKAPKMGGIGLIFVLAMLGLPGMAGFVAEFLTLAGAFQTNILITAIASAGFIVSVIYALKIFQKIFYGKERDNRKIRDFNVREILVMIPLIIVIFWLGLFPGTVFRTTEKPVQHLLEYSKKSDNQYNDRPDIRSAGRLIPLKNEKTESEP